MRPYDNNSKAHPPDQVARIADQIRQHGFDQPIVINGEGVILKGHGRRLAALQLKLAQVPVVVRRNLTAEQERAIRVGDNKSAESDWLYGPLAIEFEALDLAGLDVELATGFGQAEIDEILTAAQDIETEEADTEKAKQKLTKTVGTVKVVLEVDQIDIIEQAIRKAGVHNRGEAFTKICQFYLTNGSETAGQFDFLPETPAPPVSPGSR